MNSFRDVSKDVCQELSFSPCSDKKYRAPLCQDKCWIHDSEGNLTKNHWKSLVISPYDETLIWITRKPASRVFLAPPEGLMTFLSSLYHAWQLLLAKFFDLVKLEFWPQGPPEPPGGQGSNLNSLFRALWWEGFALSIWFSNYKWFLRTLPYYGFTNKPKSTRKYLFDFGLYLWKLHNQN